MIPDRPADLTIVLPVPPSTNKLWKPIARGKMAQTVMYEAWKQEAGWAMNRQRASHHEFGRYAMRVAVGTGHDLDNLKAVPDLLQAQRTVINDKDCEALVIVRDRTLTDRQWSVQLWRL
ncbi:hypothetical protein [Roseomonas elaeocarpi]|uniref:Uncharacterized protein n=1 Tax=Roseomonas elaeocarpi TaxID=907779 RepID=A0ABV6JZ54_9PROT